jgi:hypothetical protein
MSKILHGKVRGRTIELDEDLGVAEGQEVEVQVRVIAKMSGQPRGGSLGTEEVLPGDAEWDAAMEEIYQARKLERRPQIPDLGDP